MKKIYGLLILSAVLYGSISTVAKPFLSNINPILLSSIIYLIIGISITIVSSITKNTSKFSWNSFKLIFLTAFFGAVVAPILYFSGLKLTDASLVSILINAEFLFTILFAITLLKENPGRYGYFGILCIFAGLIVLNLKQDNLSANFFQNNDLIGSLLILGSAIFWALDNNISKVILQKEVPIVRLIQLKSLIGGITSFVIVIILNISFTINISNIPSLLFLSLGGFAGSLFLFLKGIKEVGATKSVMIFSTSTLFGIIFAIIFLNEQIEIYRFVFSVMLMITGIMLITKDNV